MTKLFTVACALACVLLLGFGTWGSTQEAPKESFDHLFKNHEKAMIKMVMVLHLRKEALGLDLEKIDLAKKQIEKLETASLYLKSSYAILQKEAKTLLDEVVGADQSILPHYYAKEMLPLFLALLHGEKPAKLTPLQESLMKESHDGKYFLRVAKKANQMIDVFEDDTVRRRSEISRRIRLFESVLSKN